MSQEEQQKAPSADEALAFIDKIVAKVAGSRQDHIAIQGALGIIGQALQPVSLEVMDDSEPCCADESACTDEDCKDSK